MSYRKSYFRRLVPRWRNISLPLPSLVFLPRIAGCSRPSPRHGRAAVPPVRTARLSTNRLLPPLSSPPLQLPRCSSPTSVFLPRVAGCGRPSPRHGRAAAPPVCTARLSTNRLSPPLSPLLSPPPLQLPRCSSPSSVDCCMAAPPSPWSRWLSRDLRMRGMGAPRGESHCRWSGRGCRPSSCGLPVA